MKLLVITVARNEENIIPYFIHHYASIADRIMLFDHGSTDKTIEVAVNTHRALVDKDNIKCDLAVVSLKNEGWNDYLSKALKETLYKQFGAGFDIVITVDTDEFLYHRAGLRNQLELLHGVHGDNLCIKPIGIQMMSNEFPSYSGVPMTELIKHGLRDGGFDKPACFSTKLNLSCGFGMHSASFHKQNMEQSHPITNSGILLLHYKLLGFNYAIERVRSTRSNLDSKGIELAKNGIGKHLIEDEALLEDGFINLMNRFETEKVSYEDF